MKKRLLISFLIISLVAGIAFAAGLRPFAFPFIGKWNPSEDSMLIDDYGFSNIQNLRKDGKHLKGVSGHSKINTAVWNATYSYPKNGVHFNKTIPNAEDHVLLYAQDSAGGNGRIYYTNETAISIPSAENFVATALHIDASGAGLGKFSNAPQGNIVYTNGAESQIWGGNEQYPVSFITSTTTVVYSAISAKDYTEEVTNNLTTNDQVAIIGGGIDTYAKLLIHAEEADGTAGTSIIDSETTPKTITAVGNAQVDTDQAKFGTGSVLFDGTGDYLTVADSNDWYMSGNPFTVDTRVRFNSLGGANGLFGQYANGTNLWRCWWNSNIVYFQIIDGDVLKASYQFPWIPSVNTWYHIELVRNGTNVYFFVDGVSITPTIGTAIGASVVPDLAGVLEIGADTNHTNVLNGWLDEFRVSKGIARHTENFTPLVLPYSSSSRTWLVGYYRPLQGIKYYIQDANATTSTMVVKEWQGNSWATLTTTDNTDTGGVSLAVTGSVTWTATGLGEQRYIEGLSLYWYQCSITAGAGDAGGATIYQVTVDSPFGNIRNVWDGSESVVASAKLFEDSTYKDYTDQVNEDSQTSVMPLDSLVAGAEYLLLGFTEPQQGFKIKFYPGRENTTANTALSFSYWNGITWSQVRSLSDGTAEPAGTSFAKAGVISFQPVQVGTEFKRTVAEESPLYFYKLVWWTALDAEVEVSYITGIPAPEPIKGYTLSAQFQNRTFLFKENKALYSVYNAPDIYNGPDSSLIYFGTNDPVTATATIYNVFQTTGYEQLLVMKANETYRLTGTGPTDWELKQMSANVGCIASLSVAVCEIADVGEGTRRHVAIWQSGHGVVMSDGATIQTISEDIKNYWDPNSSTYIPTTRQDDSIGWYDPNLKSYKLLISSGSGQTTHNVELEYSLKTQEWTKLYRENGSGANPLQTGFQVKDTIGNSYSYGATNEGYMYRLENGKTFDGTPIAQYVQTKEMILDEKKPFFRDSIIRHIRTTLKQKSTGAGEDIGIIHYCDGTTTATVDGVNDQSTPADIDMINGKINTQDVYLGPCLTHSLKYQVENSTVYDGAELTGAGLYYESLETIRVDR